MLKYSLNLTIKQQIYFHILFFCVILYVKYVDKSSAQFHWMSSYIDVQIGWIPVDTQIWSHIYLFITWKWARWDCTTYNKEQTIDQKWFIFKSHKGAMLSSESLWMRYYLIWASCWYISTHVNTEYVTIQLNMMHSDQVWYKNDLFLTFILNICYCCRIDNQKAEILIYIGCIRKLKNAAFAGNIQRKAVRHVRMQWSCDTLSTEIPWFDRFLKAAQMYPSSWAEKWK